MTDTTQSNPHGRLLVVDDEPEMVQFLVTALEQPGYAVTGLTASPAALDTLRAGNFDVLLTDLHLPELDGLALLRAALDIDPNLMGVMMTDRAGVPAAVQALQLGAYDYLRKPFELEAIVPTVQRALELRRVRLENRQLRASVALHTFNQASSATLDPAAVAAQMAATAQQQLGADEATVLTLAPGDDALVIAGVAGSRPRAGLVGQRVPLRQSIAGWIARAGMAGEALVLNGAVDDARFTALFPRPEINSAIAMPMLADGRVTGVLTVNALAPRRPFRPEQVQALRSLANAGAAALENAARVSQPRASELRFRELFEQASDGIVLLDERGVCLTANARLTEWLGYAPGALTGRSLRGLVLDEDLPELRQDLAALRAGQNIRGERRLRRQDGTVLPVELTARRAPDGTFQAIVRDITERQQADQALRASESRYREVMERATDGIVTVSAAGDYQEVNSVLLQWLGYPRAELLRLNTRDVVIADDQTQLQRDFDAIATGQTVLAQQRLRRKDGTWLSVELTGRRLPDGGFHAFLRDITQRQQAEQALPDSETRLAALFQASPAAIAVTTLAEGRFVDVNARFEQLLGYPRAQVIGRTLVELNVLADPDSRQWVRAQLAQRHALHNVELRFRRQSGVIFDGLLSVEHLELGGVPHVVSLVLDITDRKRAEQARRDSEARLAAVFQASPAAIAVVTLAEGRYLDVNAQYERLVGYTRAEIIGHTVGELNIWLTPQDRAQMIAQLTRDGAVHDLAQRLRRQPGEIIDVVMSIERIELGGEPCLIGLVLDVTDRKRVDDQLRFQAGLLGAVGQAVVATDLEGTIRYWNHSAEALYGWPAAEVLGRNVMDITPSTLSPEKINASTRRLAAGESWTGEFSVTRRDGRLIPTLVTTTPFYDSNGALAGLIGMTTDISERKQRERELETISQISAALRGALTADQIPVVILDQLSALFSIDAATVSLLDETQAETRTAHVSGLWARGAGARAPAARGIVGHVLATSRPYLTNDVAHDPLLYAPWAAEGLSAVVVLPLIAHGKTIGALAGGRQAAFTEGDLRLLGSIADITANALQRATLHEQTRLRADQLAALNALARALAETLQLEHIYERLEAATRQLLPAVSTVVVSLFDPERQALTDVYHAQAGRRPAADAQPPAPSAAELAARAEVVQTRQPVTRNSWEGGPASVLAPLLSKGEVIGVLQAHSAGGPSFGPEAADLLATVASTAAVAIENARLFAETQRRLLRLQALRAIDLAITSSMDSRISLSVLADQAVTHLGVDAVDVLLLDQDSHRLELAVGRGFNMPPPRLALRVDESDAGRSVLERRLVHVPQLAGQRMQPGREPWVRSEGFVAYWAMPLVAKGQVRGVLEVFQRGPLTPDGEWLDFLETLAEQAAIAVENSGLFADLQRSNTDLELAYDTTLEGWSRALDLRDKETEGHTQRVTELTERLAHAMGLNDSELVPIRRGSLLHDIGKMGIPDSILLKPGPLSAEEWGIMHQHPRYAFELLTPIAYLRAALDIPYCHHEKWDGSGYPRRLKGEQIPLAARVFAVVDVWDALRSDRPYRPGWPEAKIIDYLRANSGTHFDPRVVPAFLQLLEQP